MKNVNGKIYENQVKRFRNGKIVEWTDGGEYLISPGYPPVSLSVFKSYVKSYGPEIK